MTTELFATIADEIEEQPTLPKSWRLVQLGDVCEIVRGSSPRPQGDNRYYGGNVPRLMVADVTRDGMFVTPVIDFLTEEGAKLSRPMKTGEVVMAVSGNPGLPAILAVDSCIHDGFVGLRYLDTRRIDTKYLYYSLFKSKEEQSAKATGAIFRNLTTDQVKAIEIPLPPTIEEQQRIASILDEQTKAVEQARIAVEEQLAAIRLLPRAFLRSVFESEEARSWQKRSLGEFAKVQSGYAFKTEWYVNEGIRLLRNANVFQGFIDWSDVAKLSVEARPKFEPYELNESDIVLSLDRPLVSNGLKVAKLTSQDVPSLLLQRVGRFQLKEGIDSEFLYIFLNSDSFINSIRGHDQSLGVPHISPTQVENVKISVPCIEEQRRIAEKLNAQMREVEHLKQVLIAQFVAIERMPSALLRQAFAGEV